MNVIIGITEYFDKYNPTYVFDSNKTVVSIINSLNTSYSVIAANLPKNTTLIFDLSKIKTTGIIF